MNLLDSNREREDEVYFAAAGIADPKERASYLDEACAGNPTLRQVVEEMLASQEEAEELITRATAGLAGAMVEIKASLPADGASKSSARALIATRFCSGWAMAAAARCTWPSRNCRCGAASRSR